MNEFLKIIEFLFDNNFTYNNQVYKQVEGSAMGSPSSPIFAKFVMNHLLKAFHDKVHFAIPFLFLYVDDTFTGLPKTEIVNSLNILNSLDNDIKFTHEVENNNSLPFLDLLIVRDQEKILVDLYKKPISSNRLLNYKSHHPLHQKISIVKQMNNKIENLCSDDFKEKNKKILKDTLSANNYPHFVVNSILNHSRENPKHHNNQISNQNKKFIKIPFHSELAPQINHLFKDTDHKVVFYNEKTNKQFFGNVKDKTPILQQTNVVYEIKCECNKSYIGQTAQNLKNRIQQHKNDVKNLSTKTGLCNHVQQTKHKIDFDNVKILEKESNIHKRLFLEFAHIVSDNDNKILNLQTDYKKGSTIYKNVLCKFK